MILAALGFGGKTAYDYFVEGRFLISTDDAYVGALTSIIAAKATGHITEVPVIQNQIVHKGDLLVSIDDGDYKNAVDSARARIGTQDATVARFARQRARHLQRERVRTVVANALRPRAEQFESPRGRPARDG